MWNLYKTVLFPLCLPHTEERLAALLHHGLHPLPCSLSFSSGFPSIVLTSLNLGSTFLPYGIHSWGAQGDV